MNLHVPQSEETRAELQQIAWVARQIVSPQANKPVMGIVQDTLCGIRKFTLRGCFMDRDFVQNILLWVPGWDGVVPPPTVLKPKPLWTGKQILSMCIPKGINIRGADDDSLPPGNPGDRGMWIEDGEIMYVPLPSTVTLRPHTALFQLWRGAKEGGGRVCRWFGRYHF